MGKRRRTGFKRGGVTAVNLKDAVRTAESVLSESTSGKKEGGVHLGAHAGGGKKKSKGKGKERKGKGGKHANTMLIRAHHTLNQQLATAREEGDRGRVQQLEKTVVALGGFDMSVERARHVAYQLARHAITRCIAFLMSLFLFTFLPVARHYYNLHRTRYQAASIRGEDLRNHNTSRWLVQRLKPLRAAGSGAAKLQLLDVGALSENYVKERSWLAVTAIDLNSQCSFVQQLDFFEYEPEHDGCFDVVSLSLVLNFVGDARRRGEMVLKCCRHLKQDGLLYIVLPRACVDNSRYTTVDTLLSVASAAGLVLEEQHMSARLANFLFKLNDSSAGGGGAGGGAGNAPSLEKRKIVKTGAGRNNFAILL